MKKYARVSGKRAATYLETQARRLNDAAGQARQEAEVELPADGAAIDTAYKVCRYCFNKYSSTIRNWKRNRVYYEYAMQRDRTNKIYNFLMFCDLLSAYLGLDKDC